VIKKAKKWLESMKEGIPGLQLFILLFIYIRLSFFTESAAEKVLYFIMPLKSICDKNFFNEE
jgi:hypothetical protein